MILLKSNSLSLLVMFVGKCVSVGRGMGGRRSWRLCFEALVLDQLLGRWSLLTLDLEAAQRQVPGVC